MDDDSPEARRESMINILGSWDLEGARPDEAAMQVVREYAAGALTIEQAIAKMEQVPLPSGKDAG